MKKMIKIDPVTRLEGEAKISIFMDESGKTVEDVLFQVTEFRAFEKFCIGRDVMEMPRITSAICGFCSWAHHLASVKAVDNLLGKNVPEPAEKLRELGYCAHILHSHLAHMYLLALPDFLQLKEKNVFHLMKENPSLVKDILEKRRYSYFIQEMVGGKAIHPVFAVPGGVSKSISEKERTKIEEMSRELVDFSKKSIEVFMEATLKFRENDPYYHETHYMSLVKNGKLNFYSGKIRVVNTEGKKIHEFSPEEYSDYIGEVVKDWSYAKFPYLREMGWKGLTWGKKSGIFRVGPLARMNVCERMETEGAQWEYERFIEEMGKPCHNTMAFHWARAIEILYASEKMLELSREEDIVDSKEIFDPDGELRGRGVGALEAPRGTLYHDYEVDEEGRVTFVNLIVPTTENNPSICISVKKGAEELLSNGKRIDRNILNKIEVAFRAYDPCLACSTHNLDQSIRVEIFHGSELVKTL